MYNVDKLILFTLILFSVTSVTISQERSHVTMMTLTELLLTTITFSATVSSDV